MARRPVDHGFDALDVRLPHPVRTAMGMRYLNAEGDTLSAEIALCHSSNLLLAESPPERRNKQNTTVTYNTS